METQGTCVVCYGADKYCRICNGKSCAEEESRVNSDGEYFAQQRYDDAIFEK